MNSTDALHTSSAETVPAAQRVLGTVELLEMILLEMPLFRLFVLQRANKTFRDTIASSIKLQRKMFLLPCETPPMKRIFNPLLETGIFEIRPHIGHVQYFYCADAIKSPSFLEREGIKQRQRGGINHFSQLPVQYLPIFAERPSRPPPSGRIHFVRTLQSVAELKANGDAIFRKCDDPEIEESWRRMLVVQPVTRRSQIWCQGAKRVCTAPQQEEKLSEGDGAYHWKDCTLEEVVAYLREASSHKRSKRRGRR